MIFCFGEILISKSIQHEASGARNKGWHRILQFTRGEKHSCSYLCFCASPSVVGSNTDVGAHHRGGFVNSRLHVLARRRFWHVFQTSDGRANRQALQSPRQGPVEGKYLYLPLRTLSSASHLWGGRKKVMVKKGQDPMLSCNSGLNHSTRGNKLFCRNRKKTGDRKSREQNRDFLPYILAEMC